MGKFMIMIKTVLFCVLCLSLSLNWLVYNGKLDMFGAGVSVQNVASADYLTSLAGDDVKPVNLYTKKGRK